MNIQSLICQNNYMNLNKQLLSNETSCTIMITVNFNNDEYINSELCLLAQNSDRSSSGRFELGISDKKPLLYMSGCDCKTIKDLVIIPNKWYTFSLVLDGGKKLSLYINGELTNEITDISVNFHNDNSYLLGYYRGNSYNFAGLLYDIKVYDVALNENDIKHKIFKNENPVNKNLLMYYDFNNIEGRYIKNKSYLHLEDSLEICGGDINLSSDIPKYESNGLFFLKNNKKLYSLQDRFLDLMNFNYKSLDNESIDNLDSSFENINKLIQPISNIKLTPRNIGTINDYKKYSIDFSSNIKSLNLTNELKEEKLKSVLPNFEKSYEKDGFKISTDSEYGSGYELYNAFDNINGWESGQYYSSTYLDIGHLTPVNITIELPQPKIIRKLVMDSYYKDNDYIIYGSNDDSDYKQLAKDNKTKECHIEAILDMNEPCKFIKILFKYSNSYVYLNNVKLYENDLDNSIMYILKKDNKYYNIQDKSLIELTDEELLKHSTTNIESISKFISENDLNGVSLEILTKLNLDNSIYEFSLKESFRPIEQFKGNLEICFYRKKDSKGED